MIPDQKPEWYFTIPMKQYLPTMTFNQKTELASGMADPLSSVPHDPWKFLKVVEIFFYEIRVLKVFEILNNRR